MWSLPLSSYSFFAALTLEQGQFTSNTDCSIAYCTSFPATSRLSSVSSKEADGLSETTQESVVSNYLCVETGNTGSC